jgi:nitroreductase
MDRTVNNHVIEFLAARKSAPIGELGLPGPDENDIRTMLKIASRVPDHGKLAPWRFVLYRGESRVRIGEMLAALAGKRQGELSEVARIKELERFSRAPLVIGVISRPRAHPAIPDWEKFLSGGAAAMNLLLAANALGFGANWISNWYSDDEEGRAILGLAPDERVIGFVHIGSHSGEIPERPRPDLSEIVSEYSGPWNKKQE